MALPLILVMRLKPELTSTLGRTCRVVFRVLARVVVRGGRRRPLIGLLTSPKLPGRGG